MQMLIICRITNDEDEIIDRADASKFINRINMKGGALNDISAIQNTCFSLIVDLSQMYILTIYRIIKFNNVVNE